MAFNMSKLCSFFYRDKALKTSYPDKTRSNGREELGAPTEIKLRVSLQPVSLRDRDFIPGGGGRIIDVRKIFVPSPGYITLSDVWVFDAVDGTFVTRKIDERAAYGYTEVIVERLDV